MTVVYVDLETGGVEPHHPTIQLAAMAVDESGSPLGTFEQKIAFNEAEADPEALALNHYDPALWKGMPGPSLTAGLFSRWLRPYQCVTLTSKRTGNPYTVARLAGYNAASFDAPRLRQMFGASFFPCEFLVRDVLQVALFYFDSRDDKPENFKLATVARYFGFSVENAHDALADVRLTVAVHLALKEAMLGC